MFLTETGRIHAPHVWNGYFIGDGSTIVRHLVRDGGLVAGYRPLIPVGFDGGGNVWLSDAKGTIFGRNHETGERSSVAASVSQFLHRVADDWEAVLAGGEASHHFLC